MSINNFRIDQDDERSSTGRRRRTPTDKGRLYQIDLLDKERRKLSAKLKSIIGIVNPHMVQNECDEAKKNYLFSTKIRPSFLTHKNNYHHYRMISNVMQTDGSERKSLNLLNSSKKLNY